MTTHVVTRPSAKKSTWRQWLPNVGIALIVVFCLAPFYWMVVTAFRRPSEQYDLFPVPRTWSMDSFLAAFDPTVGLQWALGSSLIVAVSTTFLALVISIPTAYALARLDLRGKSLILGLIIATSMFPGITLIVPLLKIFTNIGWINTYQAIILPNLSFALPLAVWNLTVFFRQMPYELEQAAMVDGCTPGQAFRRVILPLAAPGVFTTAILTFIAAWHTFIIPLTMVNNKEMTTVTVAISKFTGVTDHQQAFGTQMAAGLIVTIPLIIGVLIFQRRIVAGLGAGGVK